MSSNRNGLTTSVQISGNANLESSSFFVLRGDPTYIENLAVDNLTANTVITSELEATTDIVLNGGVLDVSGGVLRLNGVPVGGDPDDWANFPAISNIDASGFKLINLGTPTDASDAATKAYVDAVGLADAALWATFGAVQNADLSGFKITKLGTPTDASDAATKAYVDAIGLADAALWATFPAIQAVDMSGNKLDNVATIDSQDISNANIIINTPAVLSSGVGGIANLLIIGGADRTDISNAGVSINTRKAISGGGNGETIGQYSALGLTSTGVQRIFGQIATTADSIANGNEMGKISLSTRRGGGFVPYIVIDGSNNTVTMERGITLGATADRGIEACAFIGNAGSIDISAVGVSANINLRAQADISMNATDDVFMAAGDDIGLTAFDDITLTATTGDIILAADDNINLTTTTADINITADEEVNITGNDVNLDCTGLLSVLNITSAFGTLIAAGGAVDITAGGTTAINSTGNVTIGSLGTTSIENFNLTDSVLTKVALTADLELNNIGSLNDTTPGSVITTKATITNDATTSIAKGFEAACTSTAGDAAGFYANTVTTGALGTTAYGAYLFNTTGSAPAANAIGVFVSDVLAEAIGGTAVGLEITGSFTGGTKRGIYENAATAGVINTFMHDIGVGKDPTDATVDVSGSGKFQTTVGGRLNPTLQVVTTDGGAPGAYAQFYHNSATPAANDRAGVLDFYANNASAAKFEVARMRTLQQNTTAGAENGRMEFWVSKNGVITDTMFIDGSNSLVDISGAGLQITKDAATAAPHVQLIARNTGAVGITQDYFRDATLAANDVITQTRTFGDSLTGVKREFRRDETVCRDPTNTAEDAIVTTSIMRAGTLTQYERIDGLLNNISYGRLAGNNLDASGGTAIVAIGNEAGQNAITGAVCIGDRAGQSIAKSGTVAIGLLAGNSNLKQRAVAIGESAGRNNLGDNSVAIGYRAGEAGNGFGTVAVGDTAGQTSQGNYAVAIGTNAGQTSQSAGAFAFGIDAGQNSQGAVAIAIGGAAGRSNQGARAIAIGENAGNTSQQTHGIAIGAESGRTSQVARAIAIGENAGNVSQGGNAVAIGRNAGNNTLGTNSVAIGYDAVVQSSAVTSNVVGVGFEALRSNANPSAIGIGSRANKLNAGSNSIVIGAYITNTDPSGAGVNSIAIGRDAVANGSTANSITLNASGTAVTANQAGMFAAPIRGVALGLGVGVMFYDTTTKEIQYSTD